VGISSWLLIAHNNATMVHGYQNGDYNKAIGVVLAATAISWLTNGKVCYGKATRRPDGGCGLHLSAAISCIP
jgi:hypothetical protein